MVQANPSRNTALEQPNDEDLVIQLGYAEWPRNELITSAAFTPSKLGGDPAWIAPGIPDDQLIC